jgi:hypothetical protein
MLLFMPTLLFIALLLSAFVAAFICFRFVRITLGIFLVVVIATIVLYNQG